MAEQLQEEEELAIGILRRLEAGESLSLILPAARRLAQMMNDDVEVSWLLLESFGIGALSPADRPPEPAWSLGGRKFMRVHAVVDANDISRLAKADRSMVASHSVLELERMASDDVLGGNASPEATILKLEAVRVVHIARQEVHLYVSRQRRNAHTLRRWLSLFGKDAPTVFAAGGPLLAELRNAAESLEQPGKASTAATQARIAILTMGRELYRGGDRHTSPITGQTFEVKMEINKLHAYLDQLWERAPEDRKPLLVAAHNEVDTAYELGSRAKNPFALTQEQAEQTVRSAYAVAHAITFAGGFLVPTPSVT